VDGKVVAYPDQFVSLAEKYGLIAELGEYVVGEAVQMAKALLPGWKNRKFPLVTVNASPKQLDDNFIAHVEYLVQKAQLPPEALGIEVTESGEITADATCIPTINTLQTLGFHILLDDFGAGHSCLANIAQVPFDTVKLDRSFCMSLPSCESSALLLDAVSKLLRQLGKQALVEGVETAVQEAMMKEFQYDFAQGYYYSKPISPEMALELFFQDTDASARQAA
jgi:EAL domain-containing protein (putative c-di-GMP-specific phosphodiesterase class I)